MHQCMRYRETLRLDDLVSEQHNVEVNIARSLVDQLHSALTLFDGLEAI